MKYTPLWDFAQRRGLYVTLTPATGQGKVLVAIWVATGDTNPLVERERYVWSTARARSLGADVLKFVEDAILVAEEEIMNLQTMMDGDLERLPGLADPST